MDPSQLGTHFAGLRATVTVADENGRIIFLNDLATAHYADRGGSALIGTHLHDCHNRASQEKIRRMVARYRSGDLSPTRYHEQQADDTAQSIVVIPIIVEDQFRGIAELMWSERPELVVEK